MRPTIRFSSRQLAGANQFLLTLYGALDLDVLRREIQCGIAKLIPDDRTSLDIFSHGAEGFSVTPFPVPKYWGRLGSVMRSHLHEHRVARRGFPLNRTTSFSDRCHDNSWRRSVLYNEYYLPIGVRFQVAMNVFQIDTSFVTVGCNRSIRDFNPQDRAMLELLAPHLGCALRNGRRLDSAQWPDDDRTKKACTIIVSRATARVARLSPGASTMLLNITGREIGEGSVLPDLIKRWLEAQRMRLTSADALGHPPEPLIIRGEGRGLALHLGRTGQETTTLLLQEAPQVGSRGVAVNGRLTRREQAVLHWLAEGKRNTEIARIIGVAARTVEKHVEHIFWKMGVHSRTQAMVRAHSPRQSPPPRLGSK